jgi:multidrug resistance protein, MATE family
MIFATIAYWPVGIGAGYVLGIVLEWNAIGVWAGLSFGLATATVLMIGRFYVLTRDRGETVAA